MPAEKRRILCAEANRDVGDLIVLMLEKKGYAVRAVQTVADCLKVAAEERFDLYILNDTYIDGDSIDLCRELRASNPLTPVLLFSLDRSGHNRQHAVDTGARIYVSKTSDFVSLVQTIDHLLRP
jgi:DNA-binding response OmpR family regulator